MKDNIIEGRLNDIPYATSPPILFVYQQTASVIGGQYTFPEGAKIAFTPSRPILPNNLYIFKTFDFAMDISENDYQAATSSILQFSAYVASDAGAPAFREPLPLVKYFTDFEYILHILGSEMMGQQYNGSAPTVNMQGSFFQNRLVGNIAGILNQIPQLAGKQSVTATMAFSVQEIKDRNFIQDFKDRAEMSKNR